MKRPLMIFLGVLLMIGCTHYKRQIPSFRMPEAYPNVQEVWGAKVAAHSYTDYGEAKQAFGFDIWGAGLLPVQIVFDNRGSHTLEIDPSQTFLVDKDDNVWPVLDDKLAYDRLEGKTDMARIAAGAVKPGILGATAGAVLGAAVGVVSGENVLEAAGKGAAVGAAAGATIGGGEEVVSGTAEQEISEDLYNRSLKNKQIKPQGISRGFIFFPGEAQSVKELRLQLKEVGTGTTRSFNFLL